MVSVECTRLSNWEWRFPLAVWLISSLLTQAWGALVWSLRLIHPENMAQRYFGITPIDAGWQGWALGIWQRWDAIHYQRIAQSGYSDELLSAFFPLFPLLGRLLAGLTKTHTLFGLLVIANLAFAAALIVIYRLAADWFSPNLARLSTVFLALYPFAYFLHAPFTEALALFLIMASIYAGGCHRWAAAGLLGLLAGITRASVFPLAGALLWLTWIDRRPFPLSRSVLRYLAAVAPLIGNLMFLLWRMIQGFPPLQQTLQQYWMRSIAVPWEIVSEILERYKTDGLPPDFWFNILALLFVIAINVWGWKLLPPALRIYQVILFAFLLLNNVPHAPLQSFGRYTLAFFPNFILLAAWARTHARRLVAVGLSGFLQLLLAGMYFMWWFTG